MKQDLVSVIIPAYNAAKYIGATIESVLSQTWKNIEVIIVNDGSTDETENVINKYVTGAGIKYIKQNNCGCSGAKNAGLAAVSGDFIQYLDADDMLSSDKIEKQINVLKNKPFDIAVCRTKIFYHKPEDNDQEIDTEFLGTTKNTFDFLLNLYGANGKRGMIQPNAFLISKQLSDQIGLWDMSISPSPDEDGEYFCRAILKAGYIHLTQGMNYYRKQRVAGNSLSSKHDYLHAKGALRSITLKLNHLLAVENSDRVKRTMASHYAEFMYLYGTSYKDLFREAEEKIAELGQKKIPVTGGKNFQRLSKLVGFKTAIELKKYFG